MSALALLLLFIIKIPFGMAQDHTAWVLQHQEQSQSLIRQYEREALDLKKSAHFLFKGNRCSHHSNLSCPKPQKSKQSIETNQANTDSTIYIFVSFSMPKETLKALAGEAKKHNAVLVIRGLIDNSFLKTATFVKELGESVVLDPLLFREYNVVVVPTFIEASQTGYKKISGNITLAYALTKFKEGDE
ncbi:MAG: type-F conjugative transfer system pilin assembly protein TrbC [Alphaproteobacteria bacterium]|nr:type-F conjugative transfer system pilin assembly protein TrbC [Alphaproteobacteria bacterium]